MFDYINSTSQTNHSDEQKRRLAEAYALILSWPDPSENESADPADFGEHAETAEENAPTCESEADLV